MPTKKIPGMISNSKYASKSSKGTAVKPLSKNSKKGANTSKDSGQDSKGINNKTAINGDKGKTPDDKSDSASKSSIMSSAKNEVGKVG